MVEKKFKIGGKVRITGCWDYGTSHLHGKIGRIIAVNPTDIEVIVKGEPFTWLIWNHNAKPVNENVGMKKPETPKYYNGKVVCVKSGFPYDFTAGKVYEFVDGVVKDNRGASRYVGHRITDPTEIKGVWKFIPFVE